MPVSGAVNDRNSVKRCGDPAISHATHFHPAFSILRSLEKPFIRLDNPFFSCNVFNVIFLKYRLNLYTDTAAG